MSDIIIKNEKVISAFSENIDEILKDTLTGWDSPVKKMLTDSDSEFQKRLATLAEKVFTEVINSPDFQEKLKDKFLQTAIENMIKR